MHLLSGTSRIFKVESTQHATFPCLYLQPLESSRYCTNQTCVCVVISTTAGGGSTVTRRLHVPNGDLQL